MSDRTIPIENVTPRGDWGYISYRPSDGAILVGKSGDSDWIEIPKEIADLLGFNPVDGLEQGSDRRVKEQVSVGVGTITTYSCYLKRCKEKVYKYRMCKKHYLQLQK